MFMVFLFIKPGLGRALGIENPVTAGLRRGRGLTRYLYVRYAGVLTFRTYMPENWIAGGLGLTGQHPSVRL